MSTINSQGHVRKIKYLTTPFLGKPPGVSLLVLGLHSFKSNWLVSLLESREGIFFDKRMYKSPDHCLQRKHDTNGATVPV